MLKTREMVSIILSETQDQSSIEHIRQRLREVFNKEVSYASVGQYRSQWRKDLKIKRDARFHKDIPGRNMFNSQLVTSNHIKCIFDFFNKKNINPDEILALINNEDAQFHSIDQLVRAIKDLQDLQISFKKD